MHEWLKAIVPENTTGTRDILKTFTVSNPATLITITAGAEVKVLPGVMTGAAAPMWSCHFSR